MAFKLGSEKRRMRTPNDTPIFKKKLAKGVLAEANKDGSIFVDPSLKKGTALYKRTIKHEKQHLKDMETGKADYGKNFVKWEGKIYKRKNGYIDGPAGNLPEGHPDHPWEKSAIKAEKK